MTNLDMLLNDPDPAFLCGGCDDRRSVHLAFVEHKKGASPSLQQLKLLDGIPEPSRSECRAFYSRHDGVRLFVDTVRHPQLGYGSAIDLFPLSRWISERSNAEQIMDTREWPFDLSTSFMIGEPSYSGNYFILPTDGKYAGCILYLDHDTNSDENPLLGQSFGDFLDLIAKDPAALINQLGAYTCYSDGSTDEQWKPLMYLGNAASFVTSIGQKKRP